MHSCALQEKENYRRTVFSQARRRRAFLRKSAENYCRIAKENLRETPEGIFTYFGDQLLVPVAAAQSFAERIEGTEAGASSPRDEEKEPV